MITDLKRHGMVLTGLAIVLTMSILALLAPWLAPFDPAALNTSTPSSSTPPPAGTASNPAGSGSATLATATSATQQGPEMSAALPKEKPNPQEILKLQGHISIGTMHGCVET